MIKTDDRPSRSPRPLPAEGTRAQLEWVLPFALFLIHSSMLRTWIVDDAGISFAYARNLAAGHGLVAQPGAPPVEGYSNLLWVLVLSLFWAARLFHELWTPKLLSLAFVAGTFLVLHRSVARDGRVPSRLFAFCLAMLALQPAFVIWCVSGLENPLYVFLLSALLFRAINDVRPGTDADDRLGVAAAAGLLAAGIALTRPEGILYALVYPGLTCACAALSRAQPLRFRGIAMYGICCAVPLVAYLFVRWLYFQDILPNTYYAKSGSSIDVMWSALRLQPPGIAAVRELFTAIAGPADGILLVVFGCALVAAAVRRRLHWEAAVSLTFLGVSVSAYLLLPADWMGEYRFATPFFLFAYLGAAILSGAFHQSRMSRWRWVAAFSVAAACAAIGFQRTAAFSSRPTVPLSAVKAYNATGYNRLAELLRVHDGSLLTPDVGATLLFSRLRVYDLGMLCDRTIAATLGRDQPAFYRYVFDEVRPTFIVSGGVWVTRAAFERDPRFARDYISLRPVVGAVVTSRNPTGAFDYVRREVLEDGLYRISPPHSDIVRSKLRETLNAMNNDF